MADVVTFTGKTGTVTFDFDQQVIAYARSGMLSQQLGLQSVTFPMAQVTDIELRQPNAMKLGGFNLIINQVRYVVTGGFDFTQFAVTDKAQFPAMQDALQRVLTLNGIPGFWQENQVNAPRMPYTGQTYGDFTRQGQPQYQPGQQYQPPAGQASNMGCGSILIGVSFLIDIASIIMIPMDGVSPTAYSIVLAIGLLLFVVGLAMKKSGN